MNQQELNDQLIRENIRLQAQIDFLTWLAVDVLGYRLRFSVGDLNTNPDRYVGAHEFIIEGIKKYQIPLVESSSLLDENQKETLVQEINKIKYITPKPSKYIRKYPEAE